MRYMQNHLDTITLQSVADHFGFSLSYCSRLIKSSTGQSFNAWKRKKNYTRLLRSIEAATGSHRLNCTHPIVAANEVL